MLEVGPHGFLFDLSTTEDVCFSFGTKAVDSSSRSVPDLGLSVEM